jgi:hypothetical protein
MGGWQRLRAWAREADAARRRRRADAWPPQPFPAAAPGAPRRVCYLSPDSVVPTGGIKVFYKHVEALRTLGVDAYVMHRRRGFRCAWFESSAPVLAQDELRPGDEVVVPEVMPQAALRLRDAGVPYHLFVQNGYLTLEVLGPDETRRAYDGARSVLAISDDTLDLLRALMPGLAPPLLRVRHSIDAGRFVPGEKTAPLVTYMPRKMPQHARLVAGWLAMAHPDWRFQALDGLNEAQVAQALGRSRVFVAFSEYEGLPLPPLEAALAGNVVLGYPGWGAREYWQAPLFHEVAFGDVRGFARAFPEVARLATAGGEAPMLEAARLALARDFGAEAERALLAEVAHRLGWLRSGEADAQGVPADRSASVAMDTPAAPAAAAAPAASPE